MVAVVLWVVVMELVIRVLVIEMSVAVVAAMVVVAVAAVLWMVVVELVDGAHHSWCASNVKILLTFSSFTHPKPSGPAPLFLASHITDRDLLRRSWQCVLPDAHARVTPHVGAHHPPQGMCPLSFINNS